MKSEKFSILDQRAMMRSIVLLHGFFKPSFFDRLKKKKPKHVFVMEGRPRMESSRQICKELLARGVKPTLISDNMAGFLFYKNLVREVWVSYSSRDEDGAVCPTGALILGALGKKHKVPVCLSYGKQEIEPLAAENEVCEFMGGRLAPKGVKGYAPLVEVLPHSYITKIF